MTEGDYTLYRKANNVTRWGLQYLSELYMRMTPLEFECYQACAVGTFVFCFSNNNKRYT